MIAVGSLVSQFPDTFNSSDDVFVVVDIVQRPANRYAKLLAPTGALFWRPLNDIQLLQPDITYSR